ncbi:MAG TPA: ATP synthase subunit I [Terriglobales bacterium]|jgi:small-conductance mechanosensitive channel|nr:ATP synthase subunit I [Terriglobales bacterium]
MILDLTDDSFHAGALGRIQREMIVLGIGFSAAAWMLLGWRIAAGFACGSAIGYANFHLLKRVVGGVVERTVQSGHRQSGKGIVLRFALRYLAVACAAYVILTSYPASLHGFLVGLFLPVGAILCEAAYELYMALMHGT